VTDPRYTGVRGDFPYVGDPIKYAMAADAARLTMRFVASVDDLYAWLCKDGKAFLDQNFAGKMTGSFAPNDEKHLAIVAINGGSRVGVVNLRYMVVEAGSEGDKPASELEFDALWVKPRFLADSTKAGSLISGAKHGMWNRATQAFTRAAD